jgi:methylphosphotriester-DNA--protein-cysteine methyltransferase
MSPRKINDRNSFKRKEDLLNSADSLSLAMRPCKRCSSLEKTCTLDETSKKYICCVETSKPCDLTISLVKLRRIHKKRFRVRDAIREMKTKLYRLKHQLRQLKNEEENMMLSK